MSRINDVEQRAAVLKTALEIMRLYSAAYFGSGRFGSQADDLILVGAIFVGQAEGRPMNASKLADFAGLPRPTVIRKLRKLRNDGLLIEDGGTFIIKPELANAPQVTTAACQVRGHVKSIARKLSTMDTVAIAKGASKQLAMMAVIFSESLEYCVNAVVLLTGLHGV